MELTVLFSSSAQCPQLRASIQQSNTLCLSAGTAALLCGLCGLCGLVWAAYTHELERAPTLDKPNWSARCDTSWGRLQLCTCAVTAACAKRVCRQGRPTGHKHGQHGGAR